jgi:hypothetical protein
MNYKILKRANRSPRTPGVVLTSPTLTDVMLHFPIAEGRLRAVDIETTGLYPEHGDRIVGIGFASGGGCGYIHLDGAAPEVEEYVKQLVRTSNLIAFNVNFDGAFLRHWCGTPLNWLVCTYGMFKSLSTEGWDGQSWSLERAQFDVLGWAQSNKTVLDAELAKHGLAKHEMAKLPPEIIGPYCASDADAAWQLFEELMTYRERFPEIAEWHKLFLNEVDILIENQLQGMTIDASRLAGVTEETHQAIHTTKLAFESHPDVAHHIAEYNKEVHDAWMASQPARFNKDGKTESVRWQKWRDREARWMDDKGFNINSKPQLAWLLYTKMGFKPSKRTETGKAVVDKKVLPALGEPGKLLIQYNKWVKQRGYVQRLTEKIQQTGKLHAHFNSFGTLTTRLGGSGGLNLQNQPKTAGYLSVFAAPLGWKLVQADVEALEPKILTEFSQDRTLLSLYGPGAKPNDAYLFLAAQIPMLAKEVCKYYDPANPTKEGIALAKKHCKRERNIAKLCKLSYDYGAGAPKIHETLTLAGIQISLNEVRQIRRELDRIFAGIKRFEQQLVNMWQANGGWIPSILGTPICVDDKYLKDIVNRFCQYSGHVVLQLWLSHVQRLRSERGVEMYPYLPDNHDETIWIAPDAEAEAAAQLLTDALEATNDVLGTSIRFTAPPAVEQNLAAIKCEDYQEWMQTLSISSAS